MVLVSRKFLEDHLKPWQEVSLLRQRTSTLEGDIHRFRSLVAEKAELDKGIEKEEFHLFQAKARLLSHNVHWDDLQKIIGRVEQSYARQNLLFKPVHPVKHEKPTSATSLPNNALKSALKKSRKATKHVQFNIEECHIITNLMVRADIGKVGIYIKRSDLEVLFKGKSELEQEIKAQSELEKYSSNYENVLSKVKARRETLNRLSCLVSELQAILLLLNFDANCSMEHGRIRNEMQQ